MFVRKKKNKSGSYSIQIIDKTDGYRVIKSLGTARDPNEIARLVAIGEAYIEQQDDQYSLFPQDQHNNGVILDFVGQLQNSSVRTVGPDLIFGHLFDEIGFGIIPEPLFRDITIARLVYPTSKLKTVDYLYRYQGKSVSIDSIYLFLDRLNSSYSKQAQEVAYRHSLKILKSIKVVFYDVTTLYYEAEDEDDFRKIGFSKDGKFEHPQIMLGLLVGENGYPIGYDIFEGNTFEGKTLLPVLNQIQHQYSFGKPVVVADAAMLSKDNLNELDQQSMPFIVAARIHNESNELKQEILTRSRNLKNGESVIINKENGHRLIISYSDKRSRKDQHNRDKALQKLKKRVSSGKLTKENLNNRGYNKFLKMTGEVTVEIDNDKVQQASCWDGLKGYLTNTELSADEVIENYGQLWKIEKAFRISKTDLRIRPMYHRKRSRIEAHVLIAFVAYSIYKELERRMSEANIQFSPERAAELTHTMYEITFNLPNDPNPQRTLLNMDQEQRQLYEMFY